MARFYFHTNNPAEGLRQDDEGIEFSSIHQAKCEAVAYAGRVLCDIAEKFWDHADFEMTVSDDQGLLLFVMRVVGSEAPAIRAATHND
jgi:hypothetical protein